jgi:thiol-disulfide isomerase/thioredoxin
VSGNFEVRVPWESGANPNGPMVNVAELLRKVQREESIGTIEFERRGEWETAATDSLRWTRGLFPSLRGYDLLEETPMNCLLSTGRTNGSPFPWLPVRFLLLLFLVCICGVCICWPFAGIASAEPQERGNVIRFVRNPDPAPEFRLDDLDGKSLTLADAHGKVVLLNFWATWCGPCRAEIPDLIELQTRYKDRLQIIGLTVDDDDAGTIRKVVEETGINYPVAMASPGLRIQYGGISALPTSFMLDVQGRVMQKHEGLRDPQLYELEIRALLGLPIPARVETFEDTGQIFLAHADRASDLPGVDLSKLTPEQKQAALHRFNAETCTCGCKFTLAQCRIYDRNCAPSKARTERIVAEISRGATARPAPAKSVAPTEATSPGKSPR